MESPSRARTIVAALSATGVIALTAAAPAPAAPVQLPCLSGSPAPDQVSNPLPCPSAQGSGATGGAASNSTTTSSQSSNSTSQRKAKRRAKRRATTHRRGRRHKRTLKRRGSGRHRQTRRR